MISRVGSSRSVRVVLDPRLMGLLWWFFRDDPIGMLVVFGLTCGEFYSGLERSGTRHQND